MIELVEESKVRLEMEVPRPMRQMPRARVDPESRNAFRDPEPAKDLLALPKALIFASMLPVRRSGLLSVVVEALMPLFQVMVLLIELALIADAKVLHPPAYLILPILMALILMAFVTTEVEAVGTWPTGYEEPAQPRQCQVGRDDLIGDVGRTIAGREGWTEGEATAHIATDIS